MVEKKTHEHPSKGPCRFATKRWESPSGRFSSERDKHWISTVVDYDCYFSGT